MFRLFVALKLHNIALLIMSGINEITHIEIFKNTTEILCFLVVLFMQAFLDFLEWTGIYGRLIELLKKLLSVKMIAVIPYALLLVTIPFLIIMKILF